MDTVDKYNSFIGYLYLKDSIKNLLLILSKLREFIIIIGFLIISDRKKINIV